ncbi:hypothetical protein LV457_17475 [Mycobacterium sp. MYCO198283]|uniref:hypothetical protein n=1 Tax=Mycobacterium sp. MYCO198283 TaxID=2883505 RepID=UPI001E4E976A|nr:hypothetical protein [Mycobacterium sp. MYCO198283]MCG5434066.1 hypothetical protein [Mycobacterium sp. MYCO198283]
MNTVLYLSASGAVFETRAYSNADLAALLDGKGLHCLTSSDGQFDFWFSPAPQRCQRRANRIATELLLATTKLSAKSVPVMHGGVVIATHDSDGDLDGLSWQQLDELVARRSALSKRSKRLLSRRIARDEQRTRPPAAAAAPAGGARQGTAARRSAQRV